MNLVFTQLPRQQPKTILNTPAILYQGICQCMNVFQEICRKFKKCLQFLNTKNTIFISRRCFLFLLLKARFLRILVTISTVRFFFQIILFYYLGFLSRTFLSTTSYPFHRHLDIDNCCRQITSAHSQKPDANQELLVSECKLLTTKLRTLKSD